MPTYNISLNEDLSKIVDIQVKSGKFANRSEFFRQLIRFVFLSSKGNDINDFIYSEPYYSELKTRVKNLKSGKEKPRALKNLIRNLIFKF